MSKQPKKVEEQIPTTQDAGNGNPPPPKPKDPPSTDSVPDAGDDNLTAPQD